MPRFVRFHKTITLMMILMAAGVAGCGAAHETAPGEASAPVATPATTPAATPEAMSAETPAPVATPMATSAPETVADPGTTVVATPTPEATPAATEAATSPTAAAVEWPMTAPDVFKVRFELSNGSFVAEFHKEWAPIGVEHLYQLLKMGYYNEARFFRVATLPSGEPFVVQFGINADPALSAQWSERTIMDEPVKQQNLPGTLTFAKSGMPNSRSTQLFINLRDNSGAPAFLDQQGFAPLGRVVEGMQNIESINREYGEQPDQGLIQMQGNAYLKQNFPNMDYVKSATLVP